MGEKGRFSPLLLVHKELKCMRVFLHLITGRRGKNVLLNSEGFLPHWTAESDIVRNDICVINHITLACEATG